MQFLVIGMDGDDAEALDRRLANRDAHLAKARALFATGNLVSAGALVDDDGRMMGSAVQYDFPSREELDAVELNPSSEWVHTEHPEWHFEHLQFTGRGGQPLH
ncbi:MAG: YciI family protein, partial [Magnetospiraceae bacterium]